MISRSNWANDSRMFNVSLPMEWVVLKCWVTETNETLCFSNVCIIRLKSLLRSALDIPVITSDHVVTVHVLASNQTTKFGNSCAPHHPPIDSPSHFGEVGHE